MSMAKLARPIGSGRAATARTPLAISPALASVTISRLRRGSPTSPAATAFSAVATSAPLASMMDADSASRAAAIASRARFRASSGVGAKTRAASWAEAQIALMSAIKNPV